MMKLYRVLKVILPLLLFLASETFYAGQTGKITGTLKDKKTGEPLMGVNVYTEDKKYGTATDINGYYVLLNVPPGRYTLMASMTGYRTVKVESVGVSADKTTTIDIQLEETSAVLAQEVVITAERPVIQKDITSSELSVGSEEIKNLPVENLKDVLQLKAGVITDANGGIHIRGGRTSEVGYLIDGIPVTDNFAGEQAFGVDVQAIEEVKVISGVFNAEYGQAMSGIVDVITKQGSDKFEGNLNISSGDYLTGARNIYPGLNKFHPLQINDIKANLSGPIEIFSQKVSYYLAFRRYENQGWIYGQRRFNPKDSSFEKGNVFYINATGDNKLIPLNGNLDYNLQGKLSFNILNPLKFSDLFLFDDSTHQYYDHLYKYDPDGLPKNYGRTYNNIVTLTYVFTPSTYATLKHSLRYSKSKAYVYPDINDPRYANPQLLQQMTGYAFYTGGTKMVHYKRGTTTNIIKGDLESQVNRYNEAKTGFELRFNKINLDNQTAKYRDTVLIFDVNQFFNEGYFSYRPFSMAFYLQDKIEYESIIINAGIRYDYFNSKGLIPTDPRDPENSPKVRTKAQNQFSPRIGIAFPISADGTIHFSYGHFFQIPPLEFLYANPNFRVAPGGLYTLLGNANLKAQSTVAYEVGLHYSFFNTLGLEVIGYFKDMTNLLGTEIHDTYIGGDRYAVYANRDYGQTKGITISLYKRPTASDNVSVSLDYTFQSAQGNASDPNDAFNKMQKNKKPNIQVIPLDWDQTHTVNLSLFYIVPNNFNLGIIAKYESGFPFTPEYQNLETSFENSSRMPNKINVDLQLNKDLIVSEKNSVSLYLKVYNLFDSRNETNVFRDTGRAGYSLVSQYTPQDQGVNTLSEFLTRPDYYSEPRRIVLGLNYNFNF
ncbi:MAG: TonB-dependent receptor [Ignavibacteria bacterium]|jgi:outer membrane receptor for Fe3+-dicitrate|nr:TonB-dependent receptor [Ignavibacteria bacterium]MCU7511160.1 TonB-dependent receptor [Ignavibacteria bacterium]